jgi:hypothetical protein
VRQRDGRAIDVNRNQPTADEYPTGTRFCTENAAWVSILRVVIVMNSITYEESTNDTRAIPTRASILFPLNQELRILRIELDTIFYQR